MTNTQKPKVFIDTNIINNRAPIGGLLGSRKRLKCFENDVDLIIPQIVHDELMEHKRRAFEEEKKKLLDNKLIDQIDARKAAEELEFCEPCVLLDEDIIFSVEDIGDYEGFCKWARGLALRNEAPFENVSDKGFKDSIVAFTIDEYLIHNPDTNRPVILVSADGRLGEYFQDRNDDVICVKNLDELEKYLKESVPEKNNNENTPPKGNECEKTNIKNAAPTLQLLEARRLLTELRNSSNFAMTHTVIAELQGYMDLLADEDFLDILLSTLNNDQIMWIARDEDVKAFLEPIFNKYKDSLTIKQYNDFVNRTGWSGYAIKEPVNILSNILQSAE